MPVAAHRNALLKILSIVLIPSKNIPLTCGCCLPRTTVETCPAARTLVLTPGPCYNSAMNLFRETEDRHLAAAAPLAVRLRPRSLDEFVGQDEFLAPGKLL